VAGRPGQSRAAACGQVLCGLLSKDNRVVQRELAARVERVLVEIADRPLVAGAILRLDLAVRLGVEALHDRPQPRRLERPACERKDSGKTGEVVADVEGGRRADEDRKRLAIPIQGSAYVPLP